MKRKLALLLTCLLLAAPLCAAEEAPLTGAWVLESVSMEASLEDGSLAFAYDIAEGGGEVKLTLEPDGSAHVSVTEGILDAASLSYLTGWEADAESWAMDGENVLVTAPSGAVLTLTPEEGALCARQQGATLRFVRPEAVTSVAIRTDATLEDFAGSWTAVSTDMFGLGMSTDMLGMYMSADIEGNAITLRIAADDPVNETPSSSVDEYTGTLEGGALIVKTELEATADEMRGDELVESEDAGVTDQKTFRLREDGLMVMTWAVSGDLGMDVTFERVA
ncbi:MAG TPA: hypothetical protein IAA71_02460 [Candidatus Pullichristensenella stercoripullorum]|nr:hypothetical protein [Candidatus Pullichristensenella stercoripullorum]